jgi:hypothetical protein
MNLGLSELTDDQLVELLQEACNELAQRDPIVHKAAQAAIDHEALKLKAVREEKELQVRVIEEESRALRFGIAEKEAHLRYFMRQAIQRATEEYRDQLAKDVSALVKEEIAAGRYRVMTPEEEAVVIAANVVPVRIHIAPGFSPQAIADALELGYHVPTPERDSLTSIKCMMNGEQIEKFKGALGVAHRIEFL